MTASESSSPLISVIIPVYNVEPYLRECLDSVLNQTLRDIEIICINDCSTDGSLAVLNDYALKDERIKVIFSRLMKDCRKRAMWELRPLEGKLHAVCGFR